MLTLLYDLLLMLFAALPWAVPMFFNCCCGCNNCDPGFIRDFQVDISGMANQDCGNCSVLDGTYVATLGGDGSACRSTPTGCVWGYNTIMTLSPACSYYVIVNLTITQTPIQTPTAGHYYLSLIFSTGPCACFFGANSRSVFEADLGTTKPDCSVFSGQTLTFVANSAGCSPSITGCDGTAATVTVTAI